MTADDNEIESYSQQIYGNTECLLNWNTARSQASAALWVSS